MKTYFILFFFCLELQSQDLIPYFKNGQYGYSDVKSNIIIEPIYAEAMFFDEYGIAKVVKDSQIILIGRNGKILSKNSKAERIYTYHVLNNFSSNVLSMDTLKNIRIIRFGDMSYKFVNLKTYDTTEIYRYKGKSLSSVFVPDYHFYHGFFIGHRLKGGFQVIDHNGHIVLASEEPIFIHNQNYISYYENKNLKILDIRRNTKITLGKMTIYKFVNDDLFIVSNNIPFYDPNFLNNKDKSFKVLHHFNIKPEKKYLINVKGEMLLDSIYEDIQHYGHNHLIVRNKKYYFIGFNGKKLMKDSFDKIYPLNSDTYCGIKNRKKYLINKNLKFINNKEYDEINYHSNEKYFSYRIDNQVGLLDINYRNLVNYKGDGLYQSENKDFFYLYNNEKIGVIDKNGKMILHPIYKSCWIFENKYIRTILNEKTGLKSIDGKTIFENKYEAIEIVQNNDKIYFRPKKNGLYGCYDESLKQISYYESETFHIHNNLRIVEKTGFSKQIVDKFGVPIIFENQNSIKSLHQNDSLNYAVILHVDSSFTLLTDLFKSYKLTYSNRCPFGCFNAKNGLFGYKIGDNEGVLNYKGQIILSPSKQKVVEITTELIITERDQKYIIYDKNGKLLHLNGFDFVSDFRTRAFIIVGNNIENQTFTYIKNDCNGKKETIPKQHKNYGVINENGNFIVPMVYNDYDFYGFYHNFICLTKGYSNGDKKSYVFDSNGKAMLQTDYDNLEFLYTRSQKAIFKSIYYNKHGLIDDQGNVILPPIYKNILQIGDSDLIMVIDYDDKHHIFNGHGKLIFENVGDIKSSYGYVAIDKSNQRKNILLLNDQLTIFDDLWNICQSVNAKEIRQIRDFYLLEVKNDQESFYVNIQTCVLYKD